jgi:hypothetical protein
MKGKCVKLLLPDVDKTDKIYCIGCTNYWKSGVASPAETEVMQIRRKKM